MTTGYLYVPNERGNTVSVIDTSNDSVVATIPLSGSTPDGVAVSPNGSVAYVASESGVVDVIDTATNTVAATIQVGISADFVAFSPDGSRAYVTHYGGDSVAVIDTSGNSVIANVTVNPGSYAVAVSPDGSRAYVTSGGTVSVIDTSSNSVINTINTGVAGTGTGIAISPDGKLVYADNYSSGTVSVINTATNSVVKTINVGGGPYGVVFSPDGLHAYVANDAGTVSVIDTSTNSIIDTIGVGEAVGIAISPDGSRLYVSHLTASNTVTVIDTTTDAILDTMHVGNVPEYLAVAPAPPSPATALAVDSGISGDGVTNVGTVVVKGLVNGDTWQYSTDKGTTWINGAGTSFTLTGDGPKSVLVHQTNPAHATSNDSSFSFVLDTQAPVVTENLKNDTGTLSNDNITKDATLTGSGDLNAVVTLTIDGHSPVTTTADGLGAWNYSPSGLADGNHTVVVTETDTAGNIGTASLTFMLDTTAPAVTISGTGGLTNHSTQTISGKVVDLTAVGTTVSILDGSAVVGTTVVKSDGSWTDSITLTGDGTHKLTAQDTDLADNVGTSNTVAFTLDTTAPIPTITNETLSNGKVTLAGTTAEANDAISVFDGSSLLGTVKTDSSGNWNFVTSQVSNAVHVYTASATDPAGNVGQSPNEAILGSTKADTLVGGPGNDLIIGNGGNDTFKGGGGADTLFGGSGHDAFVFNGITDSTPASHDTIVNFNHTTDQIEFANIAGITGSNGTPTFEGKLAGSGNLTLNAHSVGYIEVGGNTEVLVNTTTKAETVTLSDTHAANMEIGRAPLRRSPARYAQRDRDSPRADEPRFLPPLICPIDTNSRLVCWGQPSASPQKCPLEYLFRFD